MGSNTASRSSGGSRDKQCENDSGCGARERSEGNHCISRSIEREGYHGADGSSARHAQQVGLRECIAQCSLQRTATHSKSRPDEHCKQNAGKPQILNDGHRCNVAASPDGKKYISSRNVDYACAKRKHRQRCKRCHHGCPVPRTMLHQKVIPG